MFRRYLKVPGEHFDLASLAYAVAAAWEFNPIGEENIVQRGPSRDHEIVTKRTKRYANLISHT